MFWRGGAIPVEEIIKQVAPILNILSPIILGVLAYWEFNKRTNENSTMTTSKVVIS
ncbi:hypothetical protein AAULR_24261 [Lacticaseibacillus rhamnosus MTCC 5462]|nr:hypothetical protein AAULR_24261 [Lacticaseibacillus rhamnosus MTCC 5462]